MGNLVLNTAPAIEPVTLAELKAHCRLDSGTFAEEISSTISIAPDAWPITASYGIVGTGVSVLNSRAVFQVSVGTVGAGATLDIKIQESNALGSGYTDWSGGAFTQITEEGTYEKAYTGIKAYARVVATVAVDAIDFGASCIIGSYETDDDTYLTALITTSRQWCEDYQSRSYITRTYDYYLDAWPEGDIIELPMSPALTCTSIVYTESDGTETTWDSEEYILDTTGFVARITPAHGYDWPSETLRPISAIKITYTAGYGATAAAVPEKIRHAIMLLAAELFENREDSESIQRIEVPFCVKALLGQDKVVRI